MCLLDVTSLTFSCHSETESEIGELNFACHLHQTTTPTTHNLHLLHLLLDDLYLRSLCSPNFSLFNLSIIIIYPTCRRSGRHRHPLVSKMYRTVVYVLMWNAARTKLKQRRVQEQKQRQRLLKAGRRIDLQAWNSWSQIESARSLASNPTIDSVISHTESSLSEPLDETRELDSALPNPESSNTQSVPADNEA